MLILIGGGEISGWNFKTKDTNQNLYQTGNIDKEIVISSNKKNPNFLFIGTASRDNEIYFNAIKNIYVGLGCNVSCLKMSDNIEEKVLQADIIYIGGGNTKYMLSEWEKMGLDKLLVNAHNKGTIIAGFSAGAYCFFKYNYEMIKGFGVINAVSCVHYNEKNGEKRTEFYNTIKEANLPGLALDNGTAIKYDKGNYKIIKSIENAQVHKITFTGNEFLKQELKENKNYNI